MRRLHRFRAVQHCVLIAVWVLTPVLATALQQGQTATVPEAKLLRGRLSLVSGERVCASVPVHSDHANNLGQAQLTVTFSAQKKPADDVILIVRLQGTQVSLTPADAAITLCGEVPGLTAKQHGDYGATDFAIHLGSGNVTNVGAPQDRFVDTEALASTLQALRIKFER